jgi:pimeloyl-ACP methyl ester carboxylesterase
MEIALVSGFAALALVIGGFVWLLVFYDNGHGGFAEKPATPRADEADADGSLRTVFFPAVDGARLEGWLHLPRGPNPPLVLMAPGLTGTKDGHLEPFARRFVRAGFAALVFDYRSFGGSEGVPRHWVDPGRHLEDWQAALRHVRAELAPAGLVDATRLALWGTSFSGGTALVAAARDPEIRAVVAQCPYLATPPSQQPGRRQMVYFVFWTVLDSFRSRLGLRPLYVPAFGRPGERVFAKSRENPPADAPHAADAHAFWQRMPAELRGGWQNKLLARVFATIDAIVPLDHVAEIRCPVYLIAGARDDMVPAEFVREAFTRLKNPAGKLSVRDCGHFDLYLDDVFAANSDAQAEFLRGVMA